MSDVDLSHVDRLVALHGRSPAAVIPLLHGVQAEYGYLPGAALERISELTDITPASLAGVSTFFDRFRHQPVGRHLIRVCLGTACHVKGAQLVRSEFVQRLQLAAGQNTDPRGRFSLEAVACLGCCTLSPVVQIDDQTFGHVGPRAVPRVLAAFERNGQAAQQRTRSEVAADRRGQLAEIRIGLGSCCVAQGSQRVHDALCDAVAAHGAASVVKRVGCSGMCHRTPLVELVRPDGTAQVFANVRPEQAASIVQEHLRPRRVGHRLRAAFDRLLDRLDASAAVEHFQPHPLDARDPAVCEFLGPQKRLATEHCQQLDPLDLDEYLRHDGFSALRRSLTELEPQQVIDLIRQSELRGRGGAGFPTYRKWETVRSAPGEIKYVICNGDEGDPGAFMDRMLLESVPYRVIEGLAIAAYTVGARQGYFYIRHEYPLAVRRIREAIARCQKRGLLGSSLLGTGFALDVQVAEGAGAFICGEETAMIHSLEGGRGTPRLRPPYPAQQGLWGRPTLINNVETLALLPWIFRHGPAAFAALGTETSKGTKVFSLAGKIRRGGLIEVPMGVTIRQIVEQIGGGVPEGRRFKAVQIGGPSGGCLPAELADTPIDYESLTAVGAIMGSGGLVVLDDTDCMVDIARYFLQFTQHEACGKCTFGRVGTKRMLEILDRLCTGHGRPGDLERLETLGRHVGAASLCGLGKTAPNPVLTTLRYFRDEYEAHLNGRCPAGKCLALIAYQINDRCIGCTICAQHCPVDAIPMVPYQKHRIDIDRCTRCDTCRIVCPEDAVQIVPLTEAGRAVRAVPGSPDPTHAVPGSDALRGSLDPSAVRGSPDPALRNAGHASMNPESTHAETDD